MPPILDNMDSSFEVASISIVRAELPYIWKLIESWGNSREGERRTGNSGTKAKPTKARQKKDTMIVNADMFGL